MEALDAVLTSLLLSEYINYAVTTREFGCSETTRRPRHQGKQRSRQDADLTTVSGLPSPPLINVHSDLGKMPTLLRYQAYYPPLNKYPVGLVKYGNGGVIMEDSGKFIGRNNVMTPYQH